MSYGTSKGGNQIDRETCMEELVSAKALEEGAIEGSGGGGTRGTWALGKKAHWEIPGSPVGLECR